jgi:putative transposase
MPRKNRIHYRYAYYHVMLRGNNRQNIFFEDQDYQAFLYIISDASNSYGFKIHLYCLMTNHIHLVIEVGDIPISKIMQSISSRYAKLHNCKYKKIGHLFQGRFKSKLITDENYLLELCYYIHMNPVKAKICASIDEYPWSSHHYYKNKISPTWVNISCINGIIFNNFSATNPYALFINNYKNSNINPLFCKFNEDGLLILMDVVNAKIKHQPSLALENIPLETIINIICKHLRVTPDEISSGSQARHISLARSIIAYFAHYHALYTLEDIAMVFYRQAGSLSKTMQRHLKLANADKKIRNIFTSVEKKLLISDADSLFI